jgi:hypothetical protein
VLELGVADDTTRADRSERPDERVRHFRPSPYHRRPPHVAAHHASAGLDHDPAIELAVVDLAVHAPFDAFEEEAVGLEEGRQLPRVDPPTGEDLGDDDVAGVDQPLDGIGDLELASPRRLDRRHRLVDAAVEEVHADEGLVGRRDVGLFDKPDDAPSVVELGHAKALRVLDMREEDLCSRCQRLFLPEPGGRRPPPLCLEAGHETCEILLEEVVAEVHDEVVVAQVVAGDQHGVGEPKGGLLVDVGDLEPEGRAVTDGLLYLLAGLADDDADLADPSRRDRL